MRIYPKSVTLVGAGLILAISILAGCNSDAEPSPEANDQSSDVRQESDSPKSNSQTDVSGDRTRKDATQVAQKPDVDSDIDQQPPAIDDPYQPPMIEMDPSKWLKNPTIEIGKDWVHLFKEKELWIDKETRTVVIGGVVFLNAGALEMFICPGKTKKHEAVVGANALASEVHAALLALGIEPGKPANWNNGYRPAYGPKINIEMKWRDAETGEIKSAPAKDWIRNTDTQEKMKADFVFGGSFIFKNPDTGQNHYLGDDGELICLSNFSTATVDISVASSQENMDLLFEAFHGNIPPVGTHVYAFITAGEVIGKPEK